MSKAIVRFDLPFKKEQQVQVLYNSPYADIDDAAVAELFDKSVQPNPTEEQIHYAKIVLRQYSNASNFYVRKIEERQTGNNNAGGAIIFAFILAIIFAPLLVILGMHNKFLLKSKYSDRSGEEYKNFTKLYTKIGIGLYGLVAVLIAVGKIFRVAALTGIGVCVLVLGGITYLILSFVLTKKYKSQE